jgi:cytochrome b6-f complex iron-sulfur subunit
MTAPVNPPSPERRTFIDYLLGTGLAATVLAVIYPIVEFLVPPRVAESTEATVTAAKKSELNPNSGKIFKFGSKPAIVIETPSGEVRAFSAICTHLQCTVQYRDDLQRIWCACHNGQYDLFGKNVSGPPPAPLEEYSVNIRGDEIVVSKG